MCVLFKIISVCESVMYKQHLHETTLLNKVCQFRCYMEVLIAAHPSPKANRLQQFIRYVSNLL